LSKVFFIRNSGSDYNELGREALELLRKIISETGHRFENEVPIKVHFGEKGNRTFIPAVCYDAVIEYLREQGVQPYYIETNVLYRGSRTTTELHLETAKAHGFTQIPIIIADGDIGTEFDEIEVNKDYISKAKIGKGYGRFNQLIVMSHFKGHGAAGFGEQSNSLLWVLLLEQESWNSIQAYLHAWTPEAASPVAYVLRSVITLLYA
jgi:uncharacterized Fe-S center protein